MSINRIALKHKYWGEDIQDLSAFSKYNCYALWRYTTRLSLLHERHNIKIQRTGARLNQVCIELHPAAELFVKRIFQSRRVVLFFADL